MDYILNSQNKINLNDTITYPIKERKNKVGVSDFVSNEIDQDIINNFPEILAGNDFRDIVNAIADAYYHHKPVIMMIGGHVIKCGLSPIIISMIRDGIITSIAMNGGASIHDCEIAMIGETSEDVGKNLRDGKFGMWTEIGELINHAICNGDQSIGEALAARLNNSNMLYKDKSILSCSYRHIPITVHSAIGADIIHYHPSFSGENFGKASAIDLNIFIEQISKLCDGGAVLNVGSAVIMPEIFIKSLNVVKNLGFDVKNFTTVNFDMIKHYRPMENIVRRPSELGGKGYFIVGQHEIMIPLLASCVASRLGLNVRFGDV